MKYRIILMLFCLFMASEFLTAVERDRDLTISSGYRYTFDKTLGNIHELFFSGEDSISQYLSLSGGFSTDFSSLPGDFFFRISLKNLPSFINWNLEFLSRDFPDYDLEENTIFPTVTFLTDFFNLEAGIALRNLNSLRETSSLHILYRLEIPILDRSRFGLSLTLANFNNFRAGNISDIRYRVSGRIRLSPRLILQIDGGFGNTGQLVFSSFYSSFYGAAGVEYHI